MGASAGARLERTLTALGVDHDIKVYPGVGHGFMNDHDPPDQTLMLTSLRRFPAPATTSHPPATPAAASRPSSAATWQPDRAWQVNGSSEPWPLRLFCPDTWGSS